MSRKEAPYSWMRFFKTIEGPYTWLRFFGKDGPKPRQNKEYGPKTKPQETP